MLEYLIDSTSVRDACVGLPCSAVTRFPNIEVVSRKSNSCEGSICKGGRPSTTKVAWVPIRDYGWPARLHHSGQMVWGSALPLSDMNDRLARSGELLKQVISLHFL